MRCAYCTTRSCSRGNEQRRWRSLRTPSCSGTNGTVDATSLLLFPPSMVYEKPSDLLRDDEDEAGAAPFALPCTKEDVGNDPRGANSKMA